MKLFRILSLLPLLLMLSCSSSTEPTPPTPPLAQASIGPEGGSLEGAGFHLTVPAGAFPEEITLTLRSSDAAFPEVDGSWATGRYLLEGLPSSFAQPLQLGLDIEEQGDGEPLILIGESVFVKDLGSEDLAWQPWEAQLERGRLTTILEPPEDGRDREVDYEFMDLPLGGTFYYSSMETAHFKIYYPYPMATHATQLGVYLEEAYTDIQGLGFSYDARTRWPVRVLILAMPGNRYGEALGSVWGWNYSSMRFSTSKMSDHSGLRTTAGHEFFHIVQDFYDPRGAYARATSPSIHYWVDEASSVWAEELFSDEPLYVSSVRSGNVTEPFEGVYMGIDESARNHGYGMSALIKWIVEGLADDTVVSVIYEHIRSGEHPVEAIKSAVGGAYEDWINEFFQDYFTGLVYGVREIPYMIAGNWGQWDVTSADDTLMSWHKYPHALGAGTFKVLLNNSGLDSGSEAKFSLSGDEPRMLNVFKYSTSEDATLLGADTDSVIVGGIKELNDGGYWLIAMGVNLDEGGPEYYNSADQTVRVEIRPGTPILEALQRSERLFYTAAIGGGEHSFRHTDAWGSETFTRFNFPNMGSSIPGDIFDGPWPPLTFTGTSFNTEMDYSIWHWVISGTLSADGRKLLSCMAEGVATSEVTDGEGHVIGNDETILTFSFPSIDLTDNYWIHDEDCYLSYSVRSSNVDIFYSRSIPYLNEDEEIEFETWEYLGTDWYDPIIGFIFSQTAP